MRSNTSFAILGMSDEQCLTDASFSLASGLFFVGYVLGQVPSTLAVERVVGMHRALTTASRLSATLALASSMGHVGGFVGPYLLGALHDSLPGPPCPGAPSAPHHPNHHPDGGGELARGEAAPALCASSYAAGTAKLGTAGLVLICSAGVAMLRDSPELRRRGVQRRPDRA